MANPIQSAWRQLAYAFDRAFKTGNRRHEFETKYSKHGDYFGYQTKISLGLGRPKFFHR